MAHVAYGRHAAYVECCAIHDRCIHLNLACCIENGTTARIESRVVLQFTHNGFHCIQGGASSMKDSLPDPGGGETSPTTGCSLLRGDRPRAPMQKESPGTIRHGHAREPETQSSGTRTSLPLAAERRPCRVSRPPQH